MSSDPIASATKGAIKGALEYSEEKIKAWVKRFRDKDLVFIEDSKTIEEVKQQRKKGEFTLFSRYVDNKEYRILFQMGLTLRYYEKNGIDFTALKGKIFKRYQRKGIHIAQFVQNGLFSKYLGIILEKSITEDQVKAEINKLFDEIEKTVIFITRDDNIEQRASEITTKIRAHSPETFIISSAGAAMQICEIIEKKVMNRISSEYAAEIYVAEGSLKESKRIYFLNRKSKAI